MEILIAGILSTGALNLIKKWNNQLKGTILEGDAALILSAVIALISAAVKVFWINGTPFILGSYNTMASEFAQIWTVSQGIYFIISRDLTPATPAATQQ